MKIFIKLLLLFSLIAIIKCSSPVIKKNHIKPYGGNTRYWQYKNKPVLLLGASDDDNLFQLASGELEQQLNRLRDAGGNYIRNTMSSRDSGNVWPFYRQPDGKYDLDQWNKVYWDKFENLLKLTNERDIIVQIEIWDRFDFSRDPWKVNPFNPVNNINYSGEESGLDSDYPKHPGSDVQPFFHSVIGMPLYKPVLGTVKKYQEIFVNKLLSYSLQYGNVLYCMDNETNTPPMWGKYWMSFIQEKAGDVEVYTTDMFDEFFKPQSCRTCRAAISEPATYTFLDVSQINSRNFGRPHWDTLQWILGQREKYELRPVNCVKVYGGGSSSWGSGTNRDGMERFYRDVMGGCAAVRHHRPPSGNGLNGNAMATIKTVRKVESVIKFWDIEPRMNLLDDSQENEAYIAGDGKTFVLYFTKGGKVDFKPGDTITKISGRWINGNSGDWAGDINMTGHDKFEIIAPDIKGCWMAVFSVNQ